MIQAGSISKVNSARFHLDQIHLIKIPTELKPKDLANFFN